MTDDLTRIEREIRENRQEIERRQAYLEKLEAARQLILNLRDEPKRPDRPTAVVSEAATEWDGLSIVLAAEKALKEHGAPMTFSEIADYATSRGFRLKDGKVPDRDAFRRRMTESNKKLPESKKKFKRDEHGNFSLTKKS